MSSTQAVLAAANRFFVPHFSRIELAVVSLLILPLVIGGLQGAAAVVKFRSSFGDAPAPRTPSHGIVIVRPKQEGTEPMELPDFDDVCLRLLVIGDSLAVGVGQSSSCTPVLPEEIAKELSKGTRKAVYWTCAGESGASTPWITRMVKQWELGQSSADFIEAQKLEMNGLLANVDFEAGASDAEKIWRKKLDRYQALFDPEKMMPFDIVVLVTGGNDLKFMLLPFLMDDKYKELYKGMTEGGGFSDDLRIFIQALNEKTEASVQVLRSRFDQTLLDIRASVETIADELEVDVGNSLDQIFGVRNVTKSDEPLKGDNYSDGHATSLTPLFVLPGLPTQAVPSLRNVPLKWLTSPVFGMLDRKKRKFADTSKSNILFVKDPALEDVIDFEEERGITFLERSREVVLLSLRDVGRNECVAIQDEMEAFYRRNAGDSTFNADIPLSKRPGKPGTKSFSPDGIHPNEFGYTVWGRHIGRSIVNRWTAN